MSDLDHQLEEQLYASASHLDVAPGDVGQVMARGRRRGRRQNAAALMAVVLVAATVAGTAVAREGGHGFSVNEKGNSGALGTPGASLHAGDVGVVWETVDPHSALGWTNSVTVGRSLYALSTAPGLTDPATSYPGRQLYQSNDGINWSAAAGPSDAYVSNLSASGAQLYAVGTGTATAGTDAGTAPIVVSSSSNGGNSWDTVPLPVDVAAIHAGFLDSTGGESINVASNATGVLVVAQVGGDLNVPKFLPAGVTAPNGWVVTSTGVDLLGPIDNPACPAGTTSTPADNLGKASGTSVAPVTPNAGTTPGPVGATYCYPPVSPSGGSSAASAASAAANAIKRQMQAGTVIQPEDDHPVTQSFTWAQLGISGDLLTAARGEPFVFFSPSGKNFQSVTLPDGPIQASQIQMAAATGNFAIAANSNTDAGAVQEQLWQSTDGVTWSPTPTPPADQVGSQAVGYLDGHLTLVSGTGTPTVATLIGDQWSEASLDAVLGPIPTGDTSYGESAAIGPFGIAVVASVQPAPTPAPPSAGTVHKAVAGSSTATSNVIDQRLLVSRDGTTWSSEALTQLAGSTYDDVVNMAVTANRFIVTAQLAGPGSNLATPEVVLVGTAR